MISLNDDLVAEIILRLPVKSVARSRCVSKTWRAAVSDDYVRRRLSPQMSLVYFPDDGPDRGKGPRFACAAGGGGKGRLEDCDLGFFPFLEGSIACDASNGLLLFRSVGMARFFVVDPVARRWTALPPPPTDAMLSMLAFDPSGTSPPRYRVINFTGWRRRVGEVEVFSSETWEWTTREADFGVLAGSLSGSMHFHGGAVYVLAFEPDCLVRMDMDVSSDEIACATIDLPEPTDGDGPITHAAGGLLHYVTSDRDRFNIWALDESAPAPQWQLRHAIKIDDVVEGGYRAGEVRFLALHPEKDAAYLWSPWRIVEYDLTRKEITGVWEFGGGEDGNKAQKKNRVFKTWLVPSSFYLSDCLADDGQVQASS